MVFSLALSQDQDLVQYSPNAISEGRLVYGHFGRYADFTDLHKIYGLQFNNSVVMLKVNQKYHAGLCFSRFDMNFRSIFGSF